MSYEPRFKCLISQEGFNHGRNAGLEVSTNIGVNGVEATLIRAKAGQDIGGGKTAVPHEGDWCAYLHTTANSRGMYWNLSPLSATNHTVTVHVRSVNPATPIPPLVFGIGTGGVVSLSKSAQIVEIAGNGYLRYKANFTASEVSGKDQCWFMTTATNGGATLEVWIDSFQFERGDVVTTFMRGTMGDGYSFRGFPNASTTWRRARYGGKRVKGGLFVGLDNGSTIRCEAALGIGIVPVTPILQERAAAPGSMYQSQSIAERAISLRLLFVAPSVSALHLLIAGVIPLLQVEDGEFTLQYTMDNITQEIDVVYSGGMDWGEIIGAGSQRVVLQLTAPDPYFREVGFTIQPLNLPTQSLTAQRANHRQEALWRSLGASPGLVKRVYATKSNALYMTTINNGDGFAYIRYWDETDWVTIGKVWGNSVRVNGVKEDLGGKKLYIWGSFGFVAKNDGSGQVTANNIAHYDLATDTWGTLSPGLNGEVNDLDFDKYGTYIYMTGAFTATSTSSVTLNRATKWEVGANAFRGLTSGLSDTGYAVLVLPDGNVVFGGNFQSAGALSSPVTGIGVQTLGSGGWSGISRSYGVGAFDKQGRETASSAFVAASATAGTRITWNAVVGAAYYEIYWAPGAGLPSGVLATGITTNQYDHTTANTIHTGYFAPPQNLAIGSGPGWVRTSPYLRSQWNGAQVTGTPRIALYKPSLDDWYTLGKKGFDNIVRVLINSRDGVNLHAFGDFIIGEGTRTFNHAAYLVGQSFLPMGKGLGTSGTVNGVALHPDGSLWVAGSHTMTGGKAISPYLSIWRGVGELGSWMPSDFAASGAIDSVTLWYGEPVVGYSGWSGTIYRPAETRFTYRGTAYEYPIIRVTGPCRLVSIENHTTNTKISFDLVLADGEVMTIDLRTGQKRIWSTGADNLMDRVVPGSDTGRFSVAPGLNIMTIDMNGHSGNTSAALYLRTTNLSADGSVA